MDLSHNSLGDSGPQKLAACLWPHLTDLNLSACGIEAVGAMHLALSCSLLPSLSKISLAYNTIEDEGAMALFTANWPALEEINVANCGLQAHSHVALRNGLKKWGSSLRIIELGVVSGITDGNINFMGHKVCLALLSVAKQNLQNLRRLQLNRAMIGANGVSHLSKATFPSLQELELMYNNIGAAGSEALGAFLARHQIRLLNLAGNALGSAGLEIINHHRGLTATLEQLNLGDNNISSEAGWEVIASFSARLPRLSTLILRENRLEIRGIQALVANRNFPRDFPNLKELDLSSTLLGPAGLHILGVAVSIDRCFPSLEKLDLADNNLGTIDGLDYTSFPNLTYLDLSDNGIDAQGGRVLRNFSLFLPRLKVLNLSKNEINIAGLYHFSQSPWPNLEELNLSGRSNHLLAEAGIFLAKASVDGKLPKLKSLNLNEAQLGDIGFANFALADWPKLEILSLEWNGIGNQGIRAFIKAGPDMPMLRVLNLNSNKLGDSGAKELFGMTGREPFEYLFHAGVGRLFKYSTIGLLLAGKFSLAAKVAVSFFIYGAFFGGRLPEGDHLVAMFPVEQPWPLLDSIHLKSNEISDSGLNSLKKVVKIRPAVKFFIPDPLSL